MIPNSKNGIEDLYLSIPIEVIDNLTT